MSSLGTHRTHHFADDRAPTFVMHRPSVSRIARMRAAPVVPARPHVHGTAHVQGTARAPTRWTHSNRTVSVSNARRNGACGRREAARHGARVMTNGSVRAVGLVRPHCDAGPRDGPSWRAQHALTRRARQRRAAPRAERASARARRAAVISRGARVFPGARARPRRPQSIPTFKIDPLKAKDI